MTWVLSGGPGDAWTHHMKTKKISLTEADERNQQDDQRNSNGRVGSLLLEAIRHHIMQQKSTSKTL